MYVTCVAFSDPPTWSENRGARRFVVKSASFCMVYGIRSLRFCVPLKGLIQAKGLKRGQERENKKISR
jgi:hypothetical protein